MTHSCLHFFSILKQNEIRRDIIFGSRQRDNCFFNRILFSGGIVFFLVGFPDFRGNFLFLKTIEIKFIPQGIVICFYGRVAIILSLYRLIRRFWLVGSGFNEYNKENKKIHILRWGFPGKERRIEFSYLFSEIQTLQLENKKQLINPTNLNLYLLLKNQQKISLIQPRVENINSLKEIERFSANLAKFLQIPLKLFLILLFYKLKLSLIFFLIFIARDKKQFYNCQTFYIFLFSQNGCIEIFVILSFGIAIHS